MCLKLFSKKKEKPISLQKESDAIKRVDWEELEKLINAIDFSDLSFYSYVSVSYAGGGSNHVLSNAVGNISNPFSTLKQRLEIIDSKDLLITYERIRRDYLGELNSKQHLERVWTVYLHK